MLFYVNYFMRFEGVPVHRDSHIPNLFTFYVLSMFVHVPNFFWGCQGRGTGVAVSNSLILGGWVTKVLRNGDKK